jgi:hypothetical protein
MIWLNTTIQLVIDLIFILTRFNLILTNSNLSTVQVNRICNFFYTDELKLNSIRFQKVSVCVSIKHLSKLLESKEFDNRHCNLLVSLFLIDFIIPQKSFIFYGMNF